MAYNERLEWRFGDIHYQQFAQVGRTEFTPGKATSGALDQNWPTDVRIPTGVGPAFNERTEGSTEMERVGVVKLGRNVVCDQTLPDAIPSMDCDTITLPNDGTLERNTGSDWDKGN